MHYYWLKKKWFFDIIVNNLLFAFLLTMSPYDMDVDMDVDYADVSSFEPASDIEVIKDIGITSDIGVVMPYQTGFTLDVYKDIEPELEFEMIPTLEVGFVLDQTPYQVEFSTARMNIVRTMLYDPNNIEMILSDQSLNLELIDAINTILVEPSDIDVVLSDLIVDSDICYAEPFEITLENEHSELEIVPEYELLNTIGLEIVLTPETRNIDLENGFELVNLLDLGILVRYINDFNVNIGFYTPIVLELKTSSIQVNTIDLSAAMEVADYMTRFYDMEGWIVEDDLTGKKFRDLR